MKLNNNGWSWDKFLIFLGIFIICLIITAINLRKLGLLEKESWFSNIFYKEEHEVVSYKSLEEKVTDASKKYIKDFYNDDLGMDTITIKVKSLINNGYLDKLEDSDGDECSGYSSVYLKDNIINYDAYIKCDDYETEGYQERKDS